MKITVVLMFIMLLTTALVGCLNQSAISTSEREYLSRADVLKKLPDIKLDDPKTGKRQAKLIAAKLDIATALTPPPRLEAYHRQLLKTLRLYGEAYELIYQDDGVSVVDRKLKTLKVRLEALIEREILNNWFAAADARSVANDEYFDIITRIFIEEQQPANENFNRYISSVGATNEGIMQRLDETSELLKKERRQLLKIRPSAELEPLHRDFLRVFLLDERANELYREALGADNEAAIEALSDLSDYYYEWADDLLAKTLRDLSTKTKKKNRWELE